MKTKKLIFMITCIVFIGLFISSFNVQSQGVVPVAHLGFPAGTLQYIDVDPAANCTAIFVGVLTVSCEYPTITEITATIDQPDWSVAVSPASIGLPGGGEQTADVSIIVKAPQKTDSDIMGIVNIIGKTRTATPWSYITRFANQVSVGINKYYVFSLYSPIPYQETTPYSKVRIPIIIENLGNAATDDIVITVENRGELRDWVIPSIQTSIPSVPGRKTNVTIEVETPRRWTMWTDRPQEIVIEVSSDTGDFSETYSTYIRMRGTHIPGFEPIILIFAIVIISVLFRKKKI